MESIIDFNNKLEKIYSLQICQKKKKDLIDELDINWKLNVYWVLTIILLSHTNLIDEQDSYLV